MNRGDVIRGTLHKYMEITHIRSQYDLMKYTTIGSTTTFRKCWRDPERFQIGDLITICDALNVPHEERLQMISKRKESEKCWK